MKPLIIIGSGGVGRETMLIVQAINRLKPTWDLKGFIDDYVPVGTEVNGVAILGSLDYLKNCHEDTYVVCAIANYEIKRKIISTIKVTYPNIKFATLIHPDVDLNSFIKIGEGCIIYQHVVLTVDIKIGDHVIICASTGVGHDSVIKDFCNVLWNCNVSGHVTIEEGCLIGSGSTIIQGLRVGPCTKVGAGSVVLKSIGYGHCTVVGTPARAVRRRIVKRVLYITTLSRTVNAFLVPHIMMLLDQGYLVDIACHVDQSLDSLLMEREVNVYHLPFTRNPFDWNNLKAFQQLKKVQKTNHYDIIHVHTPIAALYGRLLKLKFKDLKTIYTVHGFHFHEGGSFSGWMLYYPIEKVMARFTDTIITINDEDYERAQQFGISSVYKVNGVGISCESYKTHLFEGQQLREAFGLNPDDFVILMIAELNKNKNHAQLIEAIEVLKKRGKHVKVLCAGEGGLESQLRKQIQEKNLTEEISLLGYRTDISELIAMCDIGILLSYREGLPRNIMELMAAGKPVVGTNIRGIRDLIIDGKNGYIVPVGDAVATADQIEKFIDDKSLLYTFGKQALQEVEKYKMDVVLEQLKPIIG